LSTVELNGVTVYVSAIESVEDGVSHEYDRLWRKYYYDSMNIAMDTRSIRDLDDLEGELGKLVAPKMEDHPAVIVKLTSGREFRIVGKTRKEVELDIFWAMKGHRI